MVTTPKKRKLDPLLEKLEGFVKREDTDERVPAQFKQRQPAPAPPPAEKKPQPAEILKGGSEELGKIERAKSKLMQEEGISEKQAVERIAETGGTERLLNRQRTVAQVRAEEEALSQAAIAGGAAPTVNLGEDAGLFSPTTALTNLPSIGAGAIAGAGTGAVLGSFVPVVGTGIGAVAGGVIGAVTAYFAKLSVDRRQTTKNAKKVFTIATDTRYKEIMNSANLQTNTPAEVMFAYEVNVENIRASHRQLRELTKNKIAADLSGAMDELIEVEMWLQQEPLYRQQLLIALANPDPRKVQQVIPQAAQDL